MDAPTNQKSTLPEIDAPDFTYNHSLCWEDCRDIRVITLLPPDPQPSNPLKLEIKLEEVNIDQSPEYQAISYCWGGQQPRIPLLCNGRKLKITDNLALALWHLRQHISEPIRLWADAICINQSDAKEKGIQVELMRDVYRTASKVHVWLGKDRPGWHIDCAFSFLETVSDAVKDLDPPDTYIKPALRGLLPIRKVYDPDYYEHLLHLLTIPWFSRVWIIQEVSLAHDAVVHCGNSQIQWMTMLKALWLLNQGDYLNFISWHDVSRTMDETLPALDFFITTCVENWRSTEGSDLFNLLVRHRSALASNPLDKVYGLLGLVTNSTNLGIKPNYEIDVTDLYFNVAVSIIKHSGSLDILTVPRHVDSKFQLPSWVPDWSAGPSSFILGDFVTSGLKQYQASGDTTSTGYKVVGKQFLEVQAVILDEIEEIGGDFCADASLKSIQSIRQFPLLNSSICHRFWQWRRISKCRRGKLYPNGMDSMEVFQRLLFTNYVYEKGSIKHPQACYWNVRATEGWAWLLRLFRLQRYPYLYETLVGLGFSVMRLPIFLLWDPHSFLVSSTILNNCLSRTKGSYIAIVPPITAVGDKIVLVKGCWLPLVCRKKDVSWELIGNAYVPGLMLGEKWDETKCKTIRIR